MAEGAVMGGVDGSWEMGVGVEGMGSALAW